MHPVGPDTKNCVDQDIVSWHFVSSDVLKAVRRLPDSVSSPRPLPSGVVSI